MPTAFADIGFVPPVSTWLPAIPFFFLLNWGVNLGVLFFLQTKFFPNARVKEIVFGTVCITAAGYIIDAIAFNSVSGAMPFGLVFFLTAFFLILAADSILIKFLLKENVCNAIFLAFILALLTNPVAMIIVGYFYMILLLLLLVFSSLSLMRVINHLKETRPKEKLAISLFTKMVIGLAVIAIISGAFGIATYVPPNELLCNSNQPGRINVVSTRVEPFVKTGQKDFATIKLTNGVYGEITSVDCAKTAPTGVFAGNNNETMGCESSCNAGDGCTLTPDALVGPGMYDSSSSQITINYKDLVGLSQEVTLTCHAYPQIQIQ